MLHHVERADLSTAEGKDRLVSELRDVFADIPSSAVREDLIALVAERLALPPALVSSWMPTPGGAEPTSADERRRPIVQPVAAEGGAGYAHPGALRDGS